MIITPNTTLKEILDKKPQAVSIFLKHGCDVNSECDESIHDTELELCESMCHLDDLDGLLESLTSACPNRHLQLYCLKRIY